MPYSIRKVGFFMIGLLASYYTARYYVDRIFRSIRGFFPTIPCFFRLSFRAIARLATEIFASQLGRAIALPSLAIRPREVEIHSCHYMRPFLLLLLLAGTIVALIYVLFQYERRQEFGIVLEISCFRITIRCVFQPPQNFYMILFVEEYWNK